MTKLHKKIAALLTASVLSLQVTPAFAATYTFSVTGNGSNSENEIELETENKAQVNQTNTSEIVNDIKVSANTGDNDVEDNTNGDVEVKTGDTTIETVIRNQVNTNEAVVELCDCDGDVDVKVANNGSDSENEVEIERENEIGVVQKNTASIRNRLNFDANTGDNDVEDNTGGEVALKTGSVSMLTGVENIANRNLAMVGGNGGNGGSTLGIEVTGNGSDSENEAEIEFENEIGLWQYNTSDFDNHFTFAGNSGDNDMEDNTDGNSEDPSLKTGDVEIMTLVGNAAGFNGASADCGCVLDVEGSISNNGTDSENEVELELENELAVEQDNTDGFRNRLDVDAETGDNEVEDNTGGPVEVKTGNSKSIFEAINLGGLNLFGDIELEMPWSDGLL